MPKTAKAIATTCGDTFWTKQRLVRNLQLPKIAKDTGLPLGAIVTYFSGEHIPREYATRVLCQYFDIDYELGKAKFIEDHQIWNTRHSTEWFAHDKQRESEYHKKYNRNNAIPLCFSFDRTKDRDLLDKLDAIEPGNRTAYIKWVLRQHLGNDAFSTERLTPEVNALLKVVYSEVPFEIFMQMLAKLLDSKKIDAEVLYGYVSYPTYLKVLKLQNYV